MGSRPVSDQLNMACGGHSTYKNFGTCSLAALTAVAGRLTHNRRSLVKIENKFFIACHDGSLNTKVLAILNTISEEGAIHLKMLDCKFQKMLGCVSPTAFHTQPPTDLPDSSSFAN